MDTEQLRHLEHLQHTYETRLRVLEIKEANLGLSAPAELLIEVDDLRQKIANIEQRIAGIGGFQKTTPRPSPGTFIITSPTPDTQYKGKEIVTVSGSHNRTLGDHIWIFLKDIFGGYYVQNPPVELLTDGTWVATNIRPGRSIRYILAIYVNPDGNRLIRGWVRMNRWSRIEEEEVKALPGCVELARVSIRTPGSE
jgi:hypothetical protein